MVGVPDQYGSLAGQITRLEKASPQSYYVVVVNSTGHGNSATRDYADELFEDWRKQGSRRGQSFDPERSVIVVVALENHQVAVKPGTFLANQLGLHANAGRERPDPGVFPAGKREPVSRGDLSAFGRNQQLDRGAGQETPYVAVQVPASKSAERPRCDRTRRRRAPAARPARVRARARWPASSTVSPPSPRRRNQLRREWLPVIIVAVPIARDGPGVRGLDLALVPPGPGPRGRPDQGDQVEGRRRHGSAGWAQGAA